jgi:hypothetical protein
LAGYVGCARLAGLAMHRALNVEVLVKGHVCLWRV